MTYLVTGATGFIGRHLVQNLLRRKGTIYVLVREGSSAKLDTRSTPPSDCSRTRRRPAEPARPKPPSSRRRQW
jgi:uncharacterized protein YbjT (DUF2867 family)